MRYLDHKALLVAVPCLVIATQLAIVIWLGQGALLLLAIAAIVTYEIGAAVLEDFLTLFLHRKAVTFRGSAPPGTERCRITYVDASGATMGSETINFGSNS